MTLRSPSASGASHLKSSCSSFRTGSRAVQRAANDMITIVPAAVGCRQHLAPAGEAQNLDSQAGFLVDLAVQRGVQRFAEFDPAAGERVKALARRAGAADQQDLAVAKDRAADGELGTGRLDRGSQGVIRKAGNSRWIMPDRFAQV